MSGWFGRWFRRWGHRRWRRRGYFVARRPRRFMCRRVRSPGPVGRVGLIGTPWPVRGCRRGCRGLLPGRGRRCRQPVKTLGPILLFKRFSLLIGPLKSLRFRGRQTRGRRGRLTRRLPKPRCRRRRRLVTRRTRLLPIRWCGLRQSGRGSEP